MSKYSDAFFKDLLRRTRPERQSELDELFRRHRVVIAPDGEPTSLRFRVHLETKVITVATAPLSRIWAHAFAYLVVCDLMRAARAAGPDVRHVTDADPRFARAMAVLKWAMRVDARAKLKEGGEGFDEEGFPPDLAAPFHPGVEEKTHRVASDLGVLALGFILLHEIAHLELRHAKVGWPDALHLEREADAWAGRFLLEEADRYAEAAGQPPDSVRMKRLLALVVGQLWLLHFEVHLGVKDSESHPPAYDRLSNLLEQQAGDGADAAWTLAMVALRLHFQSQHGPVDADVPFDDARACYQHFADLLSRTPRREP